VSRESDFADGLWEMGFNFHQVQGYTQRKFGLTTDDAARAASSLNRDKLAIPCVGYTQTIRDILDEASDRLDPRPKDLKQSMTNLYECMKQNEASFSAYRSYRPLKPDTIEAYVRRRIANGASSCIPAEDVHRDLYPDKTWEQFANELWRLFERGQVRLDSTSPIGGPQLRQVHEGNPNNCVRLGP
jgi:hypothetical protein